jgi:hypothetical protein
MASVIVVHGINNTFSTRPQMASAWGPALLSGVELAAGTPGALSPDDIGYVSYGDVFRPSGRFLGGEAPPPLTADDVADGLETRLLLSWWEAAARVDPGVAPPNGRTLGAPCRCSACIRCQPSCPAASAIAQQFAFTPGANAHTYPNAVSTMLAHAAVSSLLSSTNQATRHGRPKLPPCHSRAHPTTVTYCDIDCRHRRHSLDSRRDRP